VHPEVVEVAVLLVAEHGDREASDDVERVLRVVVLVAVADLVDERLGDVDDVRALVASLRHGLVPAQRSR
jgi:hypothetical protein